MEFESCTAFISDVLMQAIDELFKQIEHLQNIYASGAKNSDGPAQELYEKSQMTLTRLSSELSVHSSLIIDVSIDAILLMFTLVLPL